MNSPPDSFQRHTPGPDPSPASPEDTGPRKHVRITSMSPSDVDYSEEKEEMGQNGETGETEEKEDTGEKRASQGLGPPSPASSASAIAVGSGLDAGAVIQSIERGEYDSTDIDDGDTRSLTDSIRQHIVDGGLRYHAYHAGKYLFPNDETEQYRDDMKHSLSVYLCEGEFFFAPIHEWLEKGADVLDLGTGTGKWCVELADEYPNSEFHGMDLSPIQPDWVPENVLFVVDDIEHEAGWTYPEEKFDYIHIRHTIHSIRDRPQLWERIFKHLKPGGYVEVQEFEYVAACDDNSCDGPYALRDFLRFLNDGMAALGTDILGILSVQDELAAAGFQDVVRHNLKCPIGPWAKKVRLQECGHVLRDVIMWGLVGLSRRPFRDGLKWTSVQIEMFLVDVRKSLSEDANGIPKFHSYFPYHNIYARKPLK